ncbi:formimidoylglutamate deiminase [Actinocorallia sp. A-T 12471]|uniref:formimidoylglutamate deiminase n=1 Tax=Actinocorallia sp. A-T 12471 TaxID=3089813 RepID=UPI0029CBC5D7|nr:formimidoylglutamate deiminase [Actinocorallia sp. A-T 12471]MDX6738965.1 formimidoylglutamate deiminase [Actinocorallia sp. A-T 12471]
MRWHAELAWTGDGLAEDVLIEASGGRFTAIRPGTPRPSDAFRLPGLTLPGFANTHSHAFHRALRGRVQHRQGTFWTWRERMYALAARLTPDGYFRLARGVYGEMARAGITCVGEFHYLHHKPDGTPYDEPNAMGEALLAAAAEAGIRITLLDALYLRGGYGKELEGVQLRFGDGDARAWARRVSALRSRALTRPHARVGAAVHSVRAVPREQIPTVAAWAREHAAPLHVHLSEQRAENEECLAEHGISPARLLAEAGALGPRTVVVHATHVTAADLDLLAGTSTGVCLCPTTERDLADGIGPAAAFRDAGCDLTLGTDQHVSTDMCAEARAVEWGERLKSGKRGTFTAFELLTAATSTGHEALGWPDAGRLEPGARADLVTIALDSLPLTGTDPALAAESAVFTATPSTIHHVVASGRTIVRNSHHLLLPHLEPNLNTTIQDLWSTLTPLSP